MSQASSSLHIESAYVSTEFNGLRNYEQIKYTPCQIIKSTESNLSLSDLSCFSDGSFGSITNLNDAPDFSDVTPLTSPRIHYMKQKYLFQTRFLNS